MIKHTKAFTLLEIMIVVIIVSILAVMAIVIPRGQLEKARAMEGKTQLKLIWAAEKDYYIYNGRYNDQWSDLEMDDPNTNSAYFTYYVESTDPLVIKAAWKNGTGGFQMDADGRLTEFSY